MIVVYLVVMLLVVIGFYALMFKRNLIKMIIGVSLIASGVNLFLVSLGYVEGGIAPIFTLASAEKWSTMVLPTPQALTLTSIVIGLATTALMLSLAVLVYKNYGSLDAGELRRLLDG